MNPFLKAGLIALTVTKVLGGSWPAATTMGLLRILVAKFDIKK